jgi:hypothetical protein
MLSDYKKNKRAIERLLFNHFPESKLEIIETDNLSNSLQFIANFSNGIGKANFRVTDNSLFIRSFEVDTQDSFSQKSGIGSLMLKNLLFFAFQNNIERIDLEASKIGAYFWVRRGFEIEEKTLLPIKNEIIDRVDYYLDRKSSHYNNFSSPADFTNMGRENREPNVLLGLEFNAYLNLKCPQTQTYLSSILNIPYEKLSTIKSIINDFNNRKSYSKTEFLWI